MTELLSFFYSRSLHHGSGRPLSGLGSEVLFPITFHSHLGLVASLNFCEKFYILGSELVFPSKGCCKHFYLTNNKIIFIVKGIVSFSSSLVTCSIIVNETQSFKKTYKSVVKVLCHNYRYY